MERRDGSGTTIAALGAFGIGLALALTPVPLMAQQSVQPRASATHAVTFTPDLAGLRRGAQEIRLTLPDGRVVVLERTHFEARGAGNVLWRGRVVGEPDSPAMFTVRGGFVVGSLRAFGDEFEVAIRDGQHVLERMDPARTRQGDVVSTPADVASDPAAPTDTAATTAAAVAAAADPAAEVEIDLMVLYSTRGNLGNDDAVQATIQGWVDYANSVFVNSQLAVHYRLVHMAFYAGPPVRFDRGLDGGHPVGQLRATYGADMVALVVPDNEMDPIAQGMAPYGNIISAPSLVWTFQKMRPSSGIDVLAHENGHLLGLEHDPGNVYNSDAPRLTGAYAHYVPGVFATVMSYYSPIIPYFSNPDVSYMGYATGIAGERDEASGVRLSAPLVAALSPSYPFTLGAPTGLNVVASLGSSGAVQASVVWFPMTGVSGFEVQRSSDGVTFATVGTSASYNTFVDPTVPGPGTYTYRVRGLNVFGAGPYSATRAVVILPPPSAPTNLTAVGEGANEIRLTWTDTSSTEAAFLVEILLDGVWTPFEETPANATRYIFRFGSPSTTYSFRVSSWTTLYGSSPTNTASATTLAANPGVVTGYAFNDANRSERVDVGETPAAGLVVFYDASGNGVLDADEPSITVSGAVRNAPGTNLPYISAPNYALANLPFGSRRICGGFSPTVVGNFCRSITILRTGTTQNVSFPVVEKKVGVVTMTPDHARVHSRRVELFDVSWTHTGGRWVLLKDAVIRIADRDDDEAIRFRFDEASRTFSLWDPRTRTFGPGVAAGQPITLKGRDARLHLASTQVLGTGPTGPSVVLRLALEFDDVCRGAQYGVEIKLEDDLGYQQGFDQIGRVTVRR